MDLDLIKKLVRLANNNPNENEANLAARKACKLIEEGKFDFIGKKNPEPVKKQNPINSEQYEDLMKMYREMFREKTRPRDNPKDDWWRHAPSEDFRKWTNEPFTEPKKSATIGNCKVCGMRYYVNPEKDEKSFICLSCRMNKHGDYDY